MEVKVCPNYNYQNIATAWACKEYGYNIKSTETTVVKNGNSFFLSLVTGGIAGLVGGLVRVFFFYNINVGIDLISVVSPK